MNLPVVLTIAGSDNSAGAGAQADLKTMCALGVYGVTAITCVVAEVPGKVSAIQAIEPEIVGEQIRLLFEAFPVAALKTGMLYSPTLIAKVVQTLKGCWESMAERPPLVVDPVMVASSGDPLLQPEGVALYCDKVFPLATLVTPNMDEVRVLLGTETAPENVAALREAGRALVDRFGCAFLVKGGHLRESTATDILVQADGTVTEFTADFVPGVSTHGTGCTTSAAIAALLGRGKPLVEAVREAKAFVHGAIAGYLRWEKDGRTTDALHHFAARPHGA